MPVGPDGAVSLFNEQGSLNVALDVQGWIAAPVLTVTPPLASALKAGPLTSTDGRPALAILNNANRYAMTTWWNDVYPALIAAPMHSEISPDDVAALSINSAEARPPQSTRVTTRGGCAWRRSDLAVSIATGAYNPADSGGISTTEATTAHGHDHREGRGRPLVNMPGGWGASSESTFYAAYIGTAAWLLWPDLTPQVQAEVAKVVYFEAEWGMDTPSCSTRTRPGPSSSRQNPR